MSNIEELLDNQGYWDSNEQCKIAEYIYQLHSQIKELNTKNASLRTEVDDVKQVQFPRKLEAVADGWCKKLADSQLREQQLLEAFEQVMDDIRSESYLFAGANGISVETEALANKTLAQPSDTTALEAMIQKAGEVMREKCIPIHFKQFLSDVHTAAGLLRYGKKDKGLADRLGKGVINYMTQTIPQVTLNDLK